MNLLVRGGLAGAIGTGTMTLVIAGAKWSGLLHQASPEEIIRRFEARSEVRAPRIGPPFTFRWLVAHFGFGVVSGIFYAFARPNLPRSPFKAGLVYGFGVWAAAYLGLMPALGLYPGPLSDSRDRQAVMITAHEVFGTTVAEVERRLVGRSRT